MTALVKRPDVWHFAPPHKAKTITGRVWKSEEAQARSRNAGHERVLPATRGDCSPLLSPCPWCGAVNAMRVTVDDRSNGNEVLETDRNCQNWHSDERELEVPHMAVPLRVWEHENNQSAESQERSYTELRLHQAATRDVRDSGVRSVELDDAAVSQHQESQLQGLRGTGDHRVRGVERLHGVLSGHGETTESKAFSGPNQQRGELRAEQLPVGNHEAAGTQQAKLSCPICAGRVSYRPGLGGADGTWEKYVEGTTSARMERGSGSDNTSSILKRCRPCGFVSCRHHLYLGVNERTGSIKLNFPGLEVWDLPESCALDVADRGEMTLEAVGELMNLTRERVRQLETSALEKLKALSELAAVNEGEL